MFQSPQTVWEVGRRLENEVEEWRSSADRQILALRRRQPALTDRSGQVCEPTIPCTECSKNHPKMATDKIKKNPNGTVAQVVLYPAITQKYILQSQRGGFFLSTVFAP